MDIDGKRLCPGICTSQTVLFATGRPVSDAPTILARDCSRSCVSEVRALDVLSHS